MIRRTIAPRADWASRVEALGLIWHIWHTLGGRPYWDEGVFYTFTAAQAATLEAATAELYELFLKAGQRVVEQAGLLRSFGIPDYCHEAIRAAWEAEPPALDFGRFDLGFDGRGAPKLFEFNCDTPTSLLEAVVVQAAWREERFPGLDQFNSLHDRLVAKWRSLRPGFTGTLYFAHAADDAGEDSITTSYLQDTAAEGGFTTASILIEDLGWHRDLGCFVDLERRPIEGLFKLYPWEWLVHEAFGPMLVESLPKTLWLEPIWKMIWSNKAILPVLWELFPRHPNLLAASRTPLARGDAVIKPLMVREGANVSICRAGAVVAETGGEYGEEGFVHQALYPLPETAPGVFPVIGSWIVDGEPAGMGIREDGLITGNWARFVPHVIDG